MVDFSVSNASWPCSNALQLEFLTNRLLIPQGLSLTLKDLALGRARRTAGQGIPFFVGAWCALLWGLLASCSSSCSDWIHPALQAFVRGLAVDADNTAADWIIGQSLGWPSAVQTTERLVSVACIPSVPHLCALLLRMVPMLCSAVTACTGEGDRSYLILKNVVRIRTACAHNEEDLVAALQSISRRSPGRNDSKQQEVLLAPTFSFRGRGYAGALCTANMIVLQLHKQALHKPGTCQSLASSCPNRSRLAGTLQEPCASRCPLQHVQATLALAECVSAG